MKEITASITINVPDEQHLAVSTFLKTILMLLDVSIEARDPKNDFHARTGGMHSEAETALPPEGHPLRKQFGL